MLIQLNDMATVTLIVWRIVWFQMTDTVCAIACKANTIYYLHLIVINAFFSVLFHIINVVLFDISVVLLHECGYLPTDLKSICAWFMWHPLMDYLNNNFTVFVIKKNRKKKWNFINPLLSLKCSVRVNSHSNEIYGFHHIKDSEEWPTPKIDRISSANAFTSTSQWSLSFRCVTILSQMIRVGRLDDENGGFSDEKFRWKVGILFSRMTR